MTRMHDASIGDPLIEQPEPVTLLLPVLEASTRRAGVQATRDEMISRFMRGEPRIAIVAGARDHPAQIDDDDISRRAVKAIWEQGALPFETSEPAVCDGVAQGHVGMSFSLVSRNLTALSLISQMEAHVYDAALFLDSCDKRPVGDLAAAIEIDVARRGRGRPPFYALFLPAAVMPESHLPKDVAEGIRALKGSAKGVFDDEIENLLLHRLKCNTYAMFKKLLDGLERDGALAGEKRDHYLREIAKMTCEAGGTCAFIGTGNTDKVVLHALGLVPPGAELTTKAAGEKLLGSSVATLLKAIRGKQEQLSVSRLAAANLKNSLRVYCAVGGSLNWMLHFPYIARFLGIDLRPSYVARMSDETPFLIDIAPAKDKSFFTLAIEAQAGAHSGLDSTLRALHDRKMIDASAPTITGETWGARLAASKEANDRILMKTAIRESSGVFELKSNFFESAVFKRAGIAPEALAAFDKRLFLAVRYVGEDDAQRDLLQGKVAEKLRAHAPASLLAKIAVANGFAGDAPKTLDEAVQRRAARLLVVIAGEGPRATGMPEMFYPSEYLNRDPVLRHVAALLTDGRYSGATYGPCIGHASPEAASGGLIGAIETGDLLRLDISAKRFDVLDRAAFESTGAILSLDAGALASRTATLDETQRIIDERLTRLPMSIRLFLETLTSSADGCVPRGLPAREVWE